MLALAWANLAHHKLRTALSALAVGIGIMLMLVSRGLADGSIAEVNDRMQSVDAELVILPDQDNIIFTNGAPFRQIHERHLHSVADERGPLAAAIIPVFFGQVRMGGQQQRLFGVDPAQMDVFLGHRKLLAGQPFDQARTFADRIRKGATPPASSHIEDPEYQEFLSTGLELVIDERLQSVGGYRLGDEIPIMGHDFRIVGVVQAGVAGRVFAPLQTLREIVLAGERNASMYFVKLNAGRDPAAAATTFESAFSADVRVELKSNYGHLLRDAFSSVNLYMNASSGLALAACFLFILLTMYTMVLERTREIAILKSLGVGRLGLVQLAIIEALLIALAGVVIGIGLSFGARVLIGQLAPLLTVSLAPHQIALAIAVGLVGGTLSALYPGYRAARLDPAMALARE